MNFPFAKQIRRQSADVPAIFVLALDPGNEETTASGFTTATLLHPLLSSLAVSPISSRNSRSKFIRTRDLAGCPDSSCYTRNLSLKERRRHECRDWNGNSLNTPGYSNLLASVFLPRGCPGASFQLCKISFQNYLRIYWRSSFGALAFNL
ncbi:hypothetical protein K0M31_005033, partial [Melipona bicolor]